MTTNVYAAKRALFDRLAELAQPGGRLDGVQVAYSYPGSTVGLKCVYGGGVTFDQGGDEDLEDGKTRLAKEVAQIAVHVRVAVTPPPPGGVRDTDARAEQIGVVIGEVLTREPRLAGGGSVTKVVGGAGMYEPLDDQAVSTLTYRVSVESYVEL